MSTYAGEGQEKERRFSFGVALDLVKSGYLMQRKGWNGKGMFIFLVPGSTFKVNRAPLMGIFPEGTEIQYRSHIDIKAADGRVSPWVPSQSDLLADDWIKVFDPNTPMYENNSPVGD